MKMGSSDYLKYHFLHHLIFLIPDKNKKYYYGFGSPNGSKKIQTGDIVIRATNELITEYKNDCITIEQVDEKKITELLLPDPILWKLSITNYSMIKKEYRNLCKKHGLEIPNKIKLTNPPSDWVWTDKINGIYQFGLEGNIKVSGKKNSRKIFQEAMDLFEISGKISIRAMHTNTGISKEIIRVTFNQFSENPKFIKAGISFMSHGKGYYYIFYNL